MWLVNDQTFATAAHPNFRLRRAEMRLKGTVNEKMEFAIMADPAKTLTTTPSSSTDNKILQELAVTYKICDSLDVTLGQSKLPNSAEGLESPTDITLAERSIVARTYGDKREPGIKLGYKWNALKTTLMLSNGQSTNVDDTTDNKELTFRVDYSFENNLKLGAFTQMANFSYAERSRHGINASYKWNDLQVKVEAATESGNSGRTQTLGFVTEAQYTYNAWIPVARFETLHVEKGAVANARAITLGVNYLVWEQKAKVQLAASHLWDMTAPNGTPAVNANHEGQVYWLVFSAGI